MIKLPKGMYGFEYNKGILKLVYGSTNNIEISIEELTLDIMEEIAAKKKKRLATSKFLII